jgi:hypothetical protein
MSIIRWTSRPTERRRSTAFRKICRSCAVAIPEASVDAIPTRIDRETFLGPSYDLVSRRLVIRDGYVASTFEGFAHAYCTAPYRAQIEESVIQDHFEKILA